MLGGQILGGQVLGVSPPPSTVGGIILYATVPSGGTNVELRTTVGSSYSLAGSASGQATVTGTLYDLQALPTGTATVSGDLTDFIQFSGSVNGSGSVTGNLSTYLSGGSSSGNGSATGDLSQHILAGSSTGTASDTGNLTGDIFTMSATPTGIASLTANLAFLRVLAGDITGDTSVVATLFSPVDGSGSIDGDSLLTGDLQLSNLYAAVAGLATITADVDYLDGILHAQANAVGIASLIVNMRWRGLLHPGTCSGVASLSAEVRKLWLLAGAPTGSTSFAGQFDIYTLPGGPIECDSSVTVTDLIVDGHMSGTINGSTIFGVDARNMLDTYLLAPPEAASGVAVVSGYIYDRPQDFECDPISGAGTVTGDSYLSNAALTAGSSAGVAAISSAILGLTYNLYNPETIVGFAAFDTAILLLNDSGLSRGSAFITANIGTQNSGSSISNGFATFIFGPSFTLPGDLAGKTVDTWSGVGTWHAEPQTFVRVTTEIDQPPPVQTGTDIHGNPIYGSTSGVGEGGTNRINTEHINVGFWDGTYAWGPTESGIAIVDPESGLTSFKKIGPLKRKAQLADPGQLGGWYVDFRNYRTRGPRATSNGQASVVCDLFVEPKNALYGRPVGTSTVNAQMLRAAMRLLVATGNVVLAVALSMSWQGNAAKSSAPPLPIDDPTLGIDPEAFVPPVRKYRTMYV